jgi:ABC-type phosphate transport system substrate-binding protein
MRRPELALVLVFCAGVLVMTNRAEAQNKTRVRIVASKPISTALVEEWGNAFGQTSDGANVVMVIEEKFRTDGVSRFSKNQYDVLVYLGYEFSAMERLWIEWKLPGSLGALEEYWAGQVRLLALTHGANPVSQVTVGQLREVVAARRRTIGWRALGGWNREILLHMPKEESSSYRMLETVILANIDGVSGTIVGWDPVRPDAKEHKSEQEIIESTKREVEALGLLQWIGGLDTKGVKVLSIGTNEGGPFVAPLLEPRVQYDYPLSELCVLYLHPKASEAAREFCKFAVGEEGASIAAKHGLVTSWHEREFLGSERVTAMKSGKGTRLSMIGVDSARSPFQDLATEYVRAKAVVQLSYAATDADVSSIGAFVNGEGASLRELLVLADKPSTRAMELHGEKWNSLSVGKDGQPNGTGPKEHMIAGRAVAIIVNPANKLEFLTLGQIEAIFQGDVDDWAIIGGTELTAPAGPGGQPGTLDIHAFGLYAREPATAIFEKEAVPRKKWKRVTLKKDTAEAVAAVSMDPQAIAFVDLSAIPATGQSVKILPIKFGQGEKARNIAPTAENIRSAMYPLSQRYFLYVHPKASDTAKDFASFLATCGGSEATPYADTVKAVTETYQKHGLIPLADEAITRAAKDAMAEAAAKARAEEAAKARGKRR